MKTDLIQVFKLLDGKEVPKTARSLVYSACSKIKLQSRTHLPIVIEYIAKGQLDSEVKLTSALDYLLSKPGDKVNSKVREAVVIALLNFLAFVQP